MQRVQAALKEQLTRQSEKLEIDLREQVHQSQASRCKSFSHCSKRQ